MEPLCLGLQLHLSHRADGGALYVVNCTSEPVICHEAGVNGFPSLSAFRGLGWMESDRCMTSAASLQTRYVKMDYHGPLLVRNQSLKAKKV